MKYFKQLKHWGLGGFLVVFLTSLILPVWHAKYAYAQGTSKAKFIDKVSIDYEGRIWSDSNPYDDTWEYRAGDLGGVCGDGFGEDSRHKLIVSNPMSSNPTANAIIYTNEGGNCDSTTTNNIRFEEEGRERRTWNIYRRSPDELFAPVSTRWDLGSCGLTSPDTAADQDYLRPEEPGKLYRRVSSEPRNHYLAVENGDEEVRNQIRTQSETTAQFDVNGRCDQQILDLYINGNQTIRGLVLAYDGQSTDTPERCIPRIYGISGGACDDENDPGPATPGGGSGDELPPSCEEENPGISLSWFICSLLNFLDKTVMGLNEAVDQLLEPDRRYYTDESLREAWAYIRNIASFLLIIIGLVMVIGQAITRD